MYKSTHTNHPCAVWVRSSSKVNYMWLWRHAVAICNEYYSRYGKVHATEEVLIALATPPKNITSIGPTPVAQAMPEIYKNDNAVTAYRSYYLWDKRRFATWKYSPKPEWWRE